MKCSSIWFASILIASAFLLSGPGNASSPSPNPTPSRGETNKPGQQQCGTQNAMVANQVTPTQAPTAGINQVPTMAGTPPSNVSNSKHGSEPSNDWWLVIFTGGLLVVAVFQFIAMVCQARYMRRANVFTRGNLKAANRAAEAAKSSAEAATKSAFATEQQGKLATYMLQASRAASIDIIPVSAYVDYQTERTTIYFEVHNSGRTKARIEEQNFHSWHLPIDYIWPIEQPFCHGDGCVKPLPDILGRHQTMQGRIETGRPDMFVGLNQSAWQHFTVGKVLLCFSGYVRYLDEAGDSHETRICEAWTIITRRFSSLPDMPRNYNRRN